MAVRALPRRLLAFAAYGAAVAALFLILEPVLPSRANPEETAVAAPARPASAPLRVPAWAWDLHDWEATEPALRPPRPANVPKVLPRWYAEWHAWRLAVARR